VRRREEEQEKKAGMKVDYAFSEYDFDTALTKLMITAGNYNARQVGFGGMKAFDGASLSPVFFKEQLKRTFDLKVSPKELGALIAFFDLNGDGDISCNEFLVQFFRWGFKVKNTKGKDNEEEMFEEIKQEAKLDFERRIETLHKDAIDPPSSPYKESKFSHPVGLKRGDRPPAETGNIKLIRRLRAGRHSATMNLTTTSVFVEMNHVIPDEDIVGLDDPHPASTLVLPHHFQDEDLCDKDSLPVYFDHDDAELNLCSVSYQPPPFETPEFHLFSIPSEIFQMSHLEHLWVDNNKILSLPSEIQNLHHLVTLSLSNCGLREIPEEIGSLCNLERACFSKNSLESIPSTFNQCSSLLHLDLSYNLFSSIPPSIEGCYLLEELFCQGNTISSIPSFFTDFRRLFHIDFSFNQVLVVHFSF